jgi:cephalosporin-C deacetylase-like acetyl esterase
LTAAFEARIGLANTGKRPAVAALVPFLCDRPQAVTVTDQDPHAEIACFLKIHRGNVVPAMDARNSLSHFFGNIQMNAGT